MFKQGDHIMYSYHGVCYIDEIREDIIEKEKKLWNLYREISINKNYYAKRKQ